MTCFEPRAMKAPSMTYVVSSQAVREAYDASATDPRRAEQAEAALPGTMSPPAQTAARRMTVKSCAGKAAVNAAGCGRLEHGEGLAGSTLQPAGSGTILPPPIVDHSRFSTVMRSSGANGCAWRLDIDSLSTLSLNAIRSEEPT